MEGKFTSTQGSEFTLTITGYREGETIQFADNPCEITIRPVGGVYDYFPEFFAKELKLNLIALFANYFDGLLTTTLEGFPVTLKRNNTVIFTGITNGYDTQIEIRGGQFEVNITCYDIINEKGNMRLLPFAEVGEPEEISLRIMSDWEGFLETGLSMPEWENEFYSSRFIRMRAPLIVNWYMLQKEFWQRMNETFLVTFFNTGTNNLKGFVHDYSNYSGVTRTFQAVNEYPKRRYFPAAKTISMNYQSTADPFFALDFRTNIRTINFGVEIEHPSVKVRTGTDFEFSINLGTARNIDDITAAPVGFYEPTDPQTLAWALVGVGSNGDEHWWNAGTNAWGAEGDVITNLESRITTNGFQQNITSTIGDPGVTWATGLDFVTYVVKLLFPFAGFYIVPLFDSLGNPVGDRITFFDDLRATLSYNFNPGEAQNKVGVKNSLSYYRRTFGHFDGLRGYNRLNPILSENIPGVSRFTLEVNQNDFFAEEIEVNVKFDAYRQYNQYEFQYVHNLDSRDAGVPDGILFSRKAAELIKAQFNGPVMEISGDFIADETAYTNPLEPLVLEYAEGIEVLVNIVEASINCRDEIISGKFVQRK